jgi:hypothetical protein
MSIEPPAGYVPVEFARLLAERVIWWWTFSPHPSKCDLCQQPVVEGEVYAFQGDVQVGICANCAEIRLSLLPRESRRVREAKERAS